MFNLWLIQLVAAIPLRTAIVQAAAPEPPTTSAAPGVEPVAPASAPVEPAKDVVAEVRPPRLLSTPLVPYPEGQSGSHAVLVELLVKADGSVGDVAIILGDEPFASQARAAAKQWLFEPAWRKDRPAAARIRLQVTFEEPEAIPEAAAASSAPVAFESEPKTEGSPATSPKATQGASIDVDPTEVVVVGERQVDVKRLGRGEVRQLPGAFGDPFRAIEVLPGVSPIASGFPYFFVRGAPPGNVGYFFGPISVPLLYHAAVGPGVIHPSFVESVDLYAGAYPIGYGRYAGGIVAAQPAEPQQKLRAEGNVRLLDAGAFAEVPLADGRANVMLGGRYSYTGLIASLLAPGTDLGYWDYQARGTYRFDSGASVSLFGFGSHDFFRAKVDGEYVTLLDLTFHRLSANYRVPLSGGDKFEISVYGGWDRTGSGGSSDNGGADLLDIYAKTLGLRVGFEHRLSKELRLRGGADAVGTRSEMGLNLEAGDNNGPRQNGQGNGPSQPETDRLLSPFGFPDLLLVPQREARRDARNSAVTQSLYTRDDLATGFWFDLQWKPTRAITVTPGLRLDAYRTGDLTAVSLDPRLTTRFEVTKNWSMLHTLGVAHQLPSFPIPVPGLAPDASGGLQRAIQSSAGVELKLPQRITTAVTLFQNVTTNATDPFSTARYGTANPGTSSFDQRSTAHAYGLEFYARRSLTEKLGGFASYTLARSLRSVPRVSGYSSFDRRHVVNFALVYDLGFNIRAGARLLAYSGVPASVAYPEALKTPPRTPWYYRIDVRLEKRWTWDGGSWISLVAEVLNTTLNKETLDTSCYAFGCKESSFGPVTLPSLGVEASL